MFLPVAAVCCFSTLISVLGFSVLTGGVAKEFALDWSKKVAQKIVVSKFLKAS